MVEADIDLRLLHTSILYIYKVFETLVCCLEGIWVYPYAQRSHVADWLIDALSS